MIKRKVSTQDWTEKTKSDLKIETSNQNDFKKSLLKINLNQTNQRKNSLSYKPPPLSQITNASSRNQKPVKLIQKYLSSETSLNDLSQIVAIDFSSAEKKYPNYHPNQVSTKKQIQFQQSKAVPTLKKYINQNKNKFSDDFSIHLDDFEILDIYQTTNIKTNKQEQVVRPRTTKRNSGGIKRNSRVFIENQHFSGNAYIEDQINSIDISKIYKEKNQQITSKTHSRTSSVDIFGCIHQDTIKCGEKLYYLLCKDKNLLNLSDIEQSSVTCEMKLILGPILTKFKQRKYSQLNLKHFIEEFSTIMNDFSPRQRLDIIQLIQINNHAKPCYATQKLQKTVIQAPYPVRIQKIINQIDFRQRKQVQIEKSQNRLQKLTSKVDNFLDKIKIHYNNQLGSSQRNLGSTLMSRLIQIQELSGDSQEIASKRDSLSNEATEHQQIITNVYIGLTERELGEKNQQIEENSGNQIHRQEIVKFQSYSHDAKQNRNIEQIQRQEYPFYLKRQISDTYCAVQPKNITGKQEEIYRGISFKTLTLQFNQLSKYLD